MLLVVAVSLQFWEKRRRVGGGYCSSIAIAIAYYNYYQLFFSHPHLPPHIAHRVLSSMATFNLHTITVQVQTCSMGLSSEGTLAGRKRRKAPKLLHRVCHSLSSRTEFSPPYGCLHTKQAPSLKLKCKLVCSIRFISLIVKKTKTGIDLLSMPMHMPHIPIPNSAEVFLNLKSQMRMSECRRDNSSDHVPVPAHFPIVYLLALGCFSSSNLRVGYLLEKIIISISFSHERKRFNMCQQDADWAEL